MIDLKTGTVIFQSVLQALCIYLGVRAWRDRHNNGSRIFWLWFSGGFIFQLVRRIMYLLILLEIPIPDLKFFTFIVVPTGVSICYAVAMWKVYCYSKQRDKDVDEKNEQLERMRELVKGFKDAAR